MASSNDEDAGGSTALASNVVDAGGSATGAASKAADAGGPTNLTTAFVALVPDPIDSGKTRMFDEQVAAIQSAMGIAGWVRDRQWLPWDDRWLLSAADRPLAATCRRDVPGVLVFRGGTSTNKGKKAYVYLVGETLTGGPPSGALRKALDKVADASDDVRIVGPAFSGGAEGLRKVVDEWRCEEGARHEVHIISGAANGPGLAQTFGSADAGTAALTRACNDHAADAGGAGAAGDAGDGGNVGDAGITFCTTHLGVDRLECAFWRFLAHRLGVEEKTLPDGGATMLRGVGLLSEQGTVYGGASPVPQSACSWKPEVALEFPIHIAAVRDAYVAIEGRSGESPEIARRTHLDLPLTEEPGTDEPVELSPMTAASRDLALSHLLTSVSTEGIRYLGVIATSIADELFLARKVRDVAPDVRLVFFENDTLLSHPASRPYTMGSWVVTPYPFLGSDDFNVDAGAGHAHVPLESDVGEAVLNATLVAANGSGDGLLEARWPNSDANGRPLGPLVWIGVVGIDAVTPVYVSAVSVSGADENRWPSPGKLLACDGRDAMKPGELDHVSLKVDDDVTPPNLWQIALALLSLLAIRDLYTRWVRYGAMKGGGCPAAASKRKDPKEAPQPAGDLTTDRGLELVILRMRYALFAALCSALLFLGIAYGCALDIAALGLYESHGTSADFMRWAVLFVSVFVGLWAFCHGIHAGIVFVRLFRRLGPRGWTIPGNADASAATFWRSRCKKLSGVLPWVLRFVGLEQAKRRADRIYLARRLEACRCLLIAALGLGLLYGAGMAVLGNTKGHAGPNWTLFVLRALPLVGGLSPAWPTLCLIVSVYWWARTRLNILWLRYTMVLRSPDDGGEMPRPPVDERPGLALPVTAVLQPAEGKIEDGLSRLEALTADAGTGVATRWHVLQTLGAVVLLVVPLVLQPPSTLEDRYGNLVLVFELAVAAGLTLSALLDLANYWAALARFLDGIALRPGGASLHLADGDQDGSPFSLASLMTPPPVRSAGHSQAWLAKLLDDVGRPAEKETAELVNAVREAQEERSKGGMASPKTEGETVFRLACSAARMLRASSPYDDTEGPRATFVATLLALFVRQYVRHLSVMMFGVSAQVIALLIAVAGYAIEPKRLLMTCAWVVLFAIASVALWILVGINRNATLSRLSGTRPGRVDWSWDFATHLFQWVAVPILLMIATQYPGTAGSLWDKFSPIVHVLR